MLSPAFWSRVVKSDGCWEWIGAKVGRGYGATYVDGRQRPAHRVAYEDALGAIPAGLDLDHLCRNRACVRPSHLEPVTRQVNLLRSPITLTAAKAAQVECIHGHPFTPENTIKHPNGTRHCRTCHNKRAREYKARRRAQKASA